MKKITLLNLFFVLIYSSFSFGQYLDEGFEDSTSIPVEWTLAQTNANETWVISTLGANTGSNVATVSYDLGTQNESLISPSLDFSSASSPRLIFSWSMSYYWGVDPFDNYDFIVSIDDGSSVIELFSEDDVGVFDNSEFYTQTIDLSAYVGLSDVKIIFNYSGADGAFLSLDDILVEEAPTCTPPTGLSVITTSTTEATVSWTAGDSETAWEYVVQAADTGEPTGAGTATTTNPLFLTGLTSNTAYEIYLRSDCSGDFSPWVSTSFLTQVACEDSLSITYENNFDGLIYSFSAPSGQYASVTVGGQTESGYDVMWITDGSGNDLYGSSAIPETGYLSGTYESTDGTILIYLDSDGSVNDEMTFAFSCYDPPTSVPDCATNFTDTAEPECGNEDFAISWDAVADANGYLITLGTTSGGTDIADAEDIGSQTTINVPNVVADQSYYYTVTPYNSFGNAEACGEQSVTTVSTVCTPCDSAIALTPGTQQSGDTAQFGNTFSDNSCLDNYDSGDDAVYSYVATEDGETMTVTVDFTATYGGVSMSLGCPSGDSTAYTCVGSASSSSSGEKSFTSDSLIAGETYYIHISTWASPQTTAYTLDTVVIEAPACLDPIALEAASITTDSADISWTSGDSSFNIEVVDITGGGTATGTATYSGVTSPYALTGLLDNNAYIVYVQTDCGADLSEWVSTGFTTLPLPIIPDYTNDFSLFPGDLWSEAEGAIADGPSGATAGWTYDNLTVPSYARFNLWNVGDNDWLISPEFDLSAQVHYLNLDVSVTAYTGAGEISMGSDDLVSLVMTTDGATWTVLKQWSAADNLGNVFVGMDEIELGISSSARFALHADEGTIDDAEDYYFNIDDFQISTTSSSLGIQEVSTLQFTYFPNPVNDKLTINAQRNVDNIVVFNMLGQVVSSQSPYSLNCLVDMASMRTGVYFVQVSIGNNTQTVRVLKQ